MGNSPSLHRDDNGAYVSAPTGYAGNYSTSGIKTGTTAGATAEIDISGFFTLCTPTNNTVLVRIANIGSNPALYAFGAAAAGANFTGNTNMALIPPNSVDYCKIDAAKVSFYHQQVTGANTIQVMVLS